MLVFAQIRLKRMFCKKNYSKYKYNYTGYYYIRITNFIQQTTIARITRLPDSTQRHLYSSGVGKVFPATSLRTTVVSSQSKYKHYVETERTTVENSVGFPKPPINKVDDNSGRGKIILIFSFYH